jgi:ribosomal peptide maturation radical SAM protein 1
MPWPGLAEPSLGLATLKAELNRHDVPCRVHHLYIGLLRHLTQQTYDTFARIVGVNEFLFTAVLDEVDGAQLDRLLDVCADPEGTRPHPRYASPIELAEVAIQIRNEVVPQYLEECAHEVLKDDPTLVGFTCMFDQTVASLALAKTLRQRRPDLMIVAGGYALFGEPGAEMVSSFPQFDGVVQGDGEPAIRGLALASVGVGSLDDVPNLITRKRPRAHHPAMADLSAAPTPDFDDWFRDVEDLDRRDHVRITPRSLPLEGSRGCWWGQTSHCTFCGIDESSLSYRSRPAEAVIKTLRELSSRYGDLEFRFSDYILARNHYEELLPILAEEEPPFRLSCEIKANQSVSRMDLRVR